MFAKVLWPPSCVNQVGRPYLTWISSASTYPLCEIEERVWHLDVYGDVDAGDVHACCEGMSADEHLSARAEELVNVRSMIGRRLWRKVSLPSEFE